MEHSTYRISAHARPILGLLTSLLFAPAAHAVDFHPLVSQSMDSGVYEFDNILIPEGVTLTLVGEPRQATLRALGDLTLAGSILAPGWNVRLEAGGNNLLLGNIYMDGGKLYVVAGRDIEIRGTLGSVQLIEDGDNPYSNASRGEITSYGFHISAITSGGPRLIDPSLRDGETPGIAMPLMVPLMSLKPVMKPVIIPSAPPVPEPETWAMLLAGLGLVGMIARRRRA